MVQARELGRILSCVLTASALFNLSVLAVAARAQDSPSLRDVIEQRSEADDETQKKSSSTGDAEIVLDELKRGTPRNVVAGYLTAGRHGDWKSAAKYLDYSQIPDFQEEVDGPLLARQFKLVMDRKLWVDLDGLSNDAEGFAKNVDGLMPDRDRVGRIEGAKRSYDISLQRVTRQDGVRIWKFAAATVAEIPKLYQEFGYGPFGHYIPQFFYDTDFLGYQLRVWFGLIVFPILCYAIAAIVTALVTLFLRNRHTTLASQLSRFATGPLRLVLAVLFFSALRRRVSVPIELGAVLAAIETVLLVATVTWMMMRIADVLWRMLNGRLIARGQRTAMGIIPPARTTLRVFLVLIAVLTILHSFGANVTALLAGLGVGGIAIALAAQKSFENLIGGVTMFADRPVLVGDFCRAGDLLGTIESIGLRSTRLRTLERTLVTIPNGEFSNMHIENYAHRDKFLFRPRLGLRYETTPDQLRYVLVEVRKMLYAHPLVDPDPARIRFVGFGAFSLDLDVFAYVNAKDYGSYLEVAEDLNLRIIDIVERAGSGFAFPSQTTYIEQGSGLDAERAREATSDVEKWRSQREMYLPQFPPEQVQKLRGTLHYPQEGSPDGPLAARKDNVPDSTTEGG
jgi:MscS family membrane protein